MIRRLSIAAMLAMLLLASLTVCQAAGMPHYRGNGYGYSYGGGGNYRGIRVPAGRTYYNGKYYGNFNNRFYGPQYGYF